MKVILISGKARHGKDTVATYIKEGLAKCGYKVLITHYADLVKYVCTTYFGWDGKKDEHGRHLLQYIGTDVVRANDPDYWVRFVYEIAKLFKDEWDYMIVPDARFPNEINTFKDSEFDTFHIRVVRENFDDGMTEEQRNHASETALDDCTPDWVVINDGTLDALMEKSHSMVNVIIVWSAMKDGRIKTVEREVQSFDIPEGENPVWTITIQKKQDGGGDES